MYIDLSISCTVAWPQSVQQCFFVASQIVYII